MINVLSAALRAIPKQKIKYKKFIRVAPNRLGLMVNVYGDPVTVDGSIQPASADTLYKLGIANTGDIYVCFLHGDAVSVAEMQSNDLIINKDGEVFNIFKSDRWYDYPNQDWNRVFLRRAKNYGSN